MSAASRSDRNRTRAARLDEQARNCLSVAVRERDQDYTATLIDEAVRLAQRSRELSRD